jgi:hypothetical protein
VLRELTSAVLPFVSSFLLVICRRTRLDHYLVGAVVLEHERVRELVVLIRRGEPEVEDHVLQPKVDPLVRRTRRALRSRLLHLQEA